ncbi:MAG: hydrogenase maturation nickel metallochaperone HypA [Bacteroidota bacterium]
MHEVSLIRTIATTLEQEFPQEELSRLTDIRLRVGLLSNVQPVLMQNAFGAVQEGEGKFPGARLHVEVLPVIVECEMCNHRSQIHNYKFVCDNCGHRTSNVIQGNELLIHQVEFADPEPVTSN